jgi:hypothetical protein
MKDEWGIAWTEEHVTRKLMAYGPKQYREDWDSAVAVAQMMAVEGPKRHLERILDSCFVRIRAYHENTDTLPFGGE